MRIVVLMDSPPSARYHRATVDAIDHAGAVAAVDLDVRVMNTDDPALAVAVANADGVVVGPGSPYRDEPAVWDAIRLARERGVPLVGT